MNVSEGGLAFLLDWEGFRQYLYDDGGRRGLGNATVAIGILVHLGPYHDRGQCPQCDKWPRETEPENTWLTLAQGMSLLSDKANATGIFAGGQNYVGAVRAAFPSGINQNQFDAMVSYSYNYGSGAVGRMARVFYAAGDMYAAFTNPLYLKPDWAAQGLLRRRRAEHALWIKPDDGSATFPVEDEMQRINGIAAYFENKGLAQGDHQMNIYVDFPHLPPQAKAVRLEIFLTVGGQFALRDGASNATYAGRVAGLNGYGVIDAFLAPLPEFGGARGLRFSIAGNVTTQRVGILGWFP